MGTKGWAQDAPRQLGNSAYWYVYQFAEGDWRLIQHAWDPWTTDTDVAVWMRNNWESRPWPDGRYRVIVTSEMDKFATTTVADVEVELSGRSAPPPEPQRLDRRRR
jgi:hypothetical protein